jgi:hypothetical protein
MLSRCFKGDMRASNDKLTHAPPPACLIPERWRKPLRNETAKVTPGSRSAVIYGSDALSIKQRERNRCRLQFARFYEVLVRPGMLLKRQHPRRSHYAPTCEHKLLETRDDSMSTRGSHAEFLQIISRALMALFAASIPVSKAPFM